MLKKFRSGVIVALGSALTLVNGGIAAAVTQERVTTNDYRLTLSIDDGSNIQSVPNMAAAPLVREGFITATVRFKAECVKQQQPCDTEDVSPSLTTWAQVGCSTQLGDDGILLQPGGTLQSGLPTALGGFLPILPGGGDVTNIGITPTISNLTPGPFKVVIKPGYISDVELGRKGKTFSKRPDEEPAKEKEMSVSVTNRHIIVDQTEAAEHSYTCLGPVAVRIRAQGRLRTSTSFDTIDIFGPLFTL